MINRSIFGYTYSGVSTIISDNYTLFISETFAGYTFLLHLYAYSSKLSLNY